MAVSAVASGPQAFRRFAEVCTQMANDPVRAQHRAELMEMAATWLRLADEAERFERLIRDLDQTFDEPSSRHAVGGPHRSSH
jgi:hypothetical protein